MRKISKCLSIVLVFLLTLIIMAPMKMQASAHFEESSDHTFIDIETNQKFTNIKKSPRNMKSVYTTLTNDDAEHISDIKELAENGVDVFVECEAPDEIEENFGFDFQNTLYETNGIMLGFLMKNTTQGMSGTPLYACCMYEENETPSTLDIMTDCVNIKNEFSITQEDIDNIAEQQVDSKKNNDVDNNVKLQATSVENLPEDKLFYEQEYYMFAYGKKLTGDTKWSKTAVDEYVRLGHAKIHMKCYNIGDKLNRNYDTAVVISEVGGYGDYSVKEYTTGIAGIGNAVICDPYCPEDTSDRKVSLSLGTGINSKGEVTTTSTVTETKSPNGQEFELKSEDEFTYLITATTMSSKKGVAWQSVSGMCIAVPKNEMGGFLCAITDVKIRCLRTYKLVDSEVALLCLYKSHKLI